MTAGGAGRLAVIGACTGAVAGLAGVTLLCGARAISAAVGVLPGHGTVTVLAPVGAGALCALLQRHIAGAYGSGVDRVLAAVRLGEPLPRSTGIGHFAGTIVCVGTGWPGGREGPMLHAGAAIGSAVADVVAPAARPQLMAAGAAGGIAGALNTPVAATLLVWGLLLRGRSGLLAAVAGALAGTTVHRLLWSPGPLYPAPDGRPASFGTACAIGLAAALTAAVYVAAVRVAPRVGDRLRRGIPVPSPLIGGLSASAVLLLFPEVAGTGERVLLGDALDGPSIALLACLLVIAVAAPAMTIATRGCSGTIGPAVVLGAVLGELIARTVAADTMACRLVGMAAVLAAATRQPLMAVAAVIELTGATGSLFAMAVSTAVAGLTASGCTTETIFGSTVVGATGDRSTGRPP